MSKELDYININRQSWNNRLEAHLQSDFYDLKGFMAGKSSLNAIELDLLGDIKGKSILHLQCHFGQDTISLSRLGAKATGVDLSDKAIAKARELAREDGADTRFVNCNIYDLPDHLTEQFDIVYTSYGVLGWLPDLDRWAKLIARYLKPGGRFIIVEFHPLVWMFDDDFKEIKYRYFNSDPIAETESGTYAQPDAEISQEYVCWNHGLAEVLNSLVSEGLHLDTIKEYDYSPYNCFDPTEEFAPGKFRIKHLGDKMPLVYALQMSKAG